MKTPIPASRYLFTLGAVIFLAGLVAGIGFSSYFYYSKISQTAEINSSLLASNKSLQQQVSQYTLEQVASLEREPTVTVHPVVRAPDVAATVPVTAQAAIPRQQATQSVIAQKPRVQPVPARSAPSTAPKVTVASSAQPTVSPNTTTRSAEPASQSNANTAAPVSMEQAGITGIDTSGVHFKSGRQVAMGGLFPSGEKLISVNPGEGKIVTDRRVIILAKPQN